MSKKTLKHPSFLCTDEKKGYSSPAGKVLVQALTLVAMFSLLAYISSITWKSQQRIKLRLCRSRSGWGGHRTPCTRRWQHCAFHRSLLIDPQVTVFSFNLYLPFAFRTDWNVSTREHGVLSARMQRVWQSFGEGGWKETWLLFFYPLPPSNSTQLSGFFFFFLRK